MSRYYMPTLVYDEPGAVLRHADEFSRLGGRAFLVTGRHSAKECGALEDVCTALAGRGIPFALFDETEENPSVETVLRAAEKGLSFGAEFVVGIGGGSPMDAAKAVAFLLRRGEARAEDLYDKTLPADALPVAEVPTTCGTGSEVTGVSVLTVHGKRTKSSIPHKIFPAVSFADGRYLKSAPRRMLVNTAVDALAHMIESYESVKADDYSRGAVLSGLRLWSGQRDVLAGGREPSEEDYARMMRASTFAGIAIAQTGTSIPHALSYILTYDLKMPHGMACGLFLASFLKEAAAEDREKLLGAAGFAGTEEFCAYMDALFPEKAVPEETLRRAYETVAANTERLKGCRFPVDGRVLARIAGI